MSKKKSNLFVAIIFSLIIGLGGGLLISRYQDQLPLISNLFNKESTEEKNENIYLAFLQEIRTIISENYWDRISEGQLIKLHVLAIEKLTGTSLGDTITSYEDLDQQILDLLSLYPDEKLKQDFTAQLADLVLSNLEPFGRSRLYSEELEQDLVERVRNIDPEADYYQALGVEKDASSEEIQAAFNKQQEVLVNDSSEAAQAKLAQIEQAYQTLADEANRTRYDMAGVNPTMEWRLLSPEVFYLHIKQFSPTTIQELIEVTQKVDDRGEELDSLILDLRGNVGGAIDGLPYFLGPFIGPNQYAYQFLQQGEITDYKTRSDWLPSLLRYKKIAVLIDDQVQSTAEVMASVLKKYNVGVLIGTKTMGWGTVERVFPIEKQISNSQQYSVFLVHHLTLKEDGTIIEGTGVSPMINVNDVGWQRQLTRYFGDSAIAPAILEQFAIVN
ncbi:MAG TPA: S41 family peptidase [Candidatus Woesebacteria bacterium]|nr:S41 family peptidase [Candidatus Woesebacteria bacterium]